MPITKEHMKSIVDEGLAMRDYCDRLRSELQSIIDRYLEGQDPAVSMELVMYAIGRDRRRPPMEVTYAESQYLKRNWKMNDWRKRHLQMRRDIARWGGDPADAQMHPRPVSGSTYTHTGVSAEDEALATAKAKARAEWLATRITKAEQHMHGVVPLTEAEQAKIARPDDASALPEGCVVLDLSKATPDQLHEAIRKAVDEA